MTEPTNTNTVPPVPVLAPPSAGDEVSLLGVWRTLGPAGPLAIIAATLPALSGFLLAGYMGTVSEFLRDQGDTGLLIYAAAFAVTSGLAILPTWVQSALGGFAFGIGRGIPAALAGFTLGSIIGYEIARRASGDRVVAAMNRNPKLKAVREALISDRLERGFLKTVGVVALLRVSPNSPFAVTNLVLASVGVPRVSYLLGTAIGMAPRTAVAVVIGHGVAEALKPGEEIRFAVPKWVLIAGVVSLIAALAILGAVANRAIERVTKGQAEPMPAK